MLAGEYIHLHFENAKVKVPTPAASFKKAREKVESILSKRYFESDSIPKGIEDIYDGTFDRIIEQVIEQMNKNEGMLADIARGGDFNLLKSQVQAWAGKQAEVSTQLTELQENIDEIDSAMNIINNKIYGLALKDPVWRELLNIKLKDGIIQLPNNITANASSQLHRAKEAFDEDNLSSFYRALPLAAGWFHEAEFLKCALEAQQCGGQAFAVIPTTISATTRDMTIKASEQLKSENNECSKLINQINQILSKEKISSGKADFFFTDISAYFGVTLKNTTENKLQAGKASIGTRQRGISLSTTSKSFINALEDNNLKTISGGNPVQSVVQSAFSIKNNSSSNKAKNNVRNILDISATLLLADALVGALKDFNAPGYVSYLVVNKHVYKTPQVLKAAIQAIKTQGRGAGKSGATVDDYQLDSLMASGSVAAHQRLKNYSSEKKEDGSNFIWGEAEEKLSALGNVKVKINLYYLMERGGLVELKI